MSWGLERRGHLEGSPLASWTDQFHIVTKFQTSYSDGPYVNVGLCYKSTSWRSATISTESQSM